MTSLFWQMPLVNSHSKCLRICYVEIIKNTSAYEIIIRNTQEYPLLSLVIDYLAGLSR